MHAEPAGEITPRVRVGEALERTFHEIGVGVRNSDDSLSSLRIVWRQIEHSLKVKAGTVASRGGADSRYLSICRFLKRSESVAAEFARIAVIATDSWAAVGADATVGAMFSG